MLSFFQVGQDLLCVLVAHLLCHVGQLVCGAHLRGQFTQTQTDAFIHNMTPNVQIFTNMSFWLKAAMC